VILDAIPSAIVVFSLNTGAYAAETVRAAIESVPVGQFEAGYMVGMNYMQIMTRVVLPQAMRTAFPPLFNTLIGLVKDTSLATILAYSEIFSIAKQISASKVSFTPFVIAGIFYFVANYVVAFIMSRIEKALDYYK
jgi:ABC-type amino acid transport system permease subunit